MDFEREREAMVRTQLRSRGVADPEVLKAMGIVPRERFVPEPNIEDAYADHPLPIGHDATISQPYIVALMTELACVSPKDRVLDVGTGSGYQAAVLAQMGAEVYGIELVEPLCAFASARLQAAGYAVDIVAGDGHLGRPEYAPYAAIVCAAAARSVPSALLEQLGVGGRLVIPIGAGVGGSVLKVFTRTEDAVTVSDSIPVRFVPLRR